MLVMSQRQKIKLKISIFAFSRDLQLDLVFGHMHPNAGPIFGTPPPSGKELYLYMTYKDGTNTTAAFDGLTSCSSQSTTKPAALNLYTTHKTIGYRLTGLRLAQAVSALNGVKSCQDECSISNVDTPWEDAVDWSCCNDAKKGRFPENCDVLQGSGM